MAFGEAFEIFAARALSARIAAARTVGYDVYDSELFPGATFQIKAARARENPVEEKAIGDREVVIHQAPTWAWSENKEGDATFYILFGVFGEFAYPFVVPLYIWRAASSSTGVGGRIKYVSTSEYSRCGRYINSSKRNKFWQYYVKVWPDGLIRRLQYYTKHESLEQPELFAA